jgi:hypothetical protein
MMRQYLLHFILLYTLLFCLENSHAIQCVSLFQDETSFAKTNYKYSKFRNTLNRELLEQSGFFINDRSELLDLTVSDDNGAPTVIGKLRMLETPVIYRWSSRQNAEYLQQTNLSEFFDVILSARGMAAGKGLYFALDSTSSHHAGDTLTIIKPESPLVVIKFKASDRLVFRRFTDDTNFVQRLRQVGVDAVTHTAYEPFWLSIISERPLKNFGTLTYENIREILTDPSLNDFAKSKLLRLNIPNSVLKQLKPDELKILNLYLTNP